MPEKDPGAPPVVEIRGVSKRFGGTQALDSVNLAFLPGEVHALVGENGAGKSTLGKIIAGLYDADKGSVAVHGKVVGRWDPARAQQQGVVMIAQELALVPELSVEQNVFLGREESFAGVMRPTMTERFTELEKLVRFGIPAKQKVKNLSIADKQKVEIMRSLARDAQVVVMDEPTSSLTAHETTRLHELIRELRTQGRTVVYVSHFLDAVLEVADRVTVMRDGVLVKTAEAQHETKQSLVAAMLGREMSVSFPELSPRIEAGVEPILRVCEISTHAIVSASLDVRPGEIVGLLGLVGSGRSEIARAIYGADSLTDGTIEFGGKMDRRRSPHGSIAQGLMFVPEDRHGQGLVLQRSVRENVSMAQTGRFSKLGVISVSKEKASVLHMAESLAMRPPRIELPVSGFSGGNQQKALLGKALLHRPKFVILDEPTRGVDIGAKSTIYDLIVDLAREGIGVLLISSEHEEVLGLSHRAYLVRGGRTVGEVDPEQTTLDQLLYQLFNIEDEDEDEEEKAT